MPSIRRFIWAGSVDYFETGAGRMDTRDRSAEFAIEFLNADRIGVTYNNAYEFIPAPFRIAMVHIGLGETDRAFEWLQKALDARDWQMTLLKVEPTFDGLRSDPRFATLLERVGLPR